MDVLKDIFLLVLIFLAVIIVCLIESCTTKISWLPSGSGFIVGVALCVWVGKSLQPSVEKRTLTDKKQRVEQRWGVTPMEHGSFDDNLLSGADTCGDLLPGADTFSDINPTTGLPMMGCVDVGGTPYGCIMDDPFSDSDFNDTFTDSMDSTFDDTFSDSMGSTFDD